MSNALAVADLPRAAIAAGNGAKWLDEVAPGWAAHVDPAGLDMSSDTHDVLGQTAEWASRGDGRRYSWWTSHSEHRSHLMESVYQTLPCDCAPDEGCNYTDDEGDSDEEDHSIYVNRQGWYGFDASFANYRALNFAWLEELRDRGVAIPAPALTTIPPFDPQVDEF